MLEISHPVSSSLGKKKKVQKNGAQHQQSKQMPFA